MLANLLWAYVEKRFVFFPTYEVECTPDQLGLAYEGVFFNTEDCVGLNGWFVPGTTDFTWILFHGNGGNIGYRATEVALLHHNLGINLLIFDYRGYGKSQGTPSEQGTYLDARAALRYLQQRSDVDPKRIIYFGHSLGTAVAVELATAAPPLALILVSPFASVRDMARIVFPLLPSGWLVRNKYNTLARIGTVQRPLLIIHGEQDELVPISQGEKLFLAANPPKRFQALPETGHNDIFEAGGQTYWGALARFLADLEPGD